jgi:hypothetical protein
VDRGLAGAVWPLVLEFRPHGRVLSSVGRASPLQGVGRRFEPVSTHHPRFPLDPETYRRGSGTLENKAFLLPLASERSLDSPAHAGVHGRGRRDAERRVPQMPTLSQSRIRTAKATEKAYKLFDERGLYMLLTPSGGRLWRFRYRHAGVEKLISLGAYPDVPLKRAREKRDEARKLLADGIDPSATIRSPKYSRQRRYAYPAARCLCESVRARQPSIRRFRGTGGRESGRHFRGRAVSRPCV